jgi:hypothetical protein
MDGLAAFDDALTGRVEHCTACGVWVDPDVICGQLVPLEGLDMEVFVAACVPCMKHWARVEAQVLAMLHQRYKKG